MTDKEFIEKLRTEMAKKAINTIEISMIGIHFNQSEAIELIKNIQAHTWPPIQLKLDY